MRRGAAAALLLAVVGVCVSLFVARGTARTNAQHARQVFRLAAMQVGANMNLGVQHETDLLVGAAAFMDEHPSARPRVLQRWVDNVHAVRRYPELAALAEIEPPGRGCPTVTFANKSWMPPIGTIGAQDICSAISSLDRARDSGRVVGFGFSMAGGLDFYGEAQPVYRTSKLPATVAARRREFVGWVAIAIYPAVVLRTALDGFPNLHLTVRTTSDTGLTFTAGPDVHGASLVERLRDGTTAIISGAVQPDSIFADTAALAILVGGGIVSILFALVLFLMGTSRARAKWLVAEKTQELAFQALHDSLTGLPNRSLVMDRAAHALARTARTGSSVALMFIDTDGFKGINDTFGHGAGDELLQQIGARLRGALRDCDTVGRLGGDEFVVLIENDQDSPSPELLAERILEVLSRPALLDSGTEVRVTASIGLAQGTRESAEELLRNADVALYAAKAAGRNRYVIFAEEMRAAVADRQALELDLRRALANEELFLVYQPIFHLDNGLLRGVEALLRWQHPERGLVPPSEFIPIAEDSDLIIELGRWVALRACRQVAAWCSRGIDLVLGVNVSGRQLDDPGFASDVKRTLDLTGLDPSCLVLEITETALMRDPSSAATRLEELRRLGVRIAIDDFGTGYSSLAYLRQFPVDSIKIDRSFIAGADASEDAAALLETLVQLGRTLRIMTLGEGIEEPSQLARLRDAGCDLGQGFLLARPLPVEGIDELLDRATVVPGGSERTSGGWSPLPVPGPVVAG